MTAERTLPEAVLESHVGILGKTGSGKSNLAKTIVEDLLDAGARVCVIDPTGTWYGLRLTRDRKPSPYRVVMFGGNHADIAIGRTHGAAVAETIGTTTTPAVIDVRTMTVGERTEFFTAFAETLLQRNKGPLHLVIDEAHLFAPQGRVSDPRSGQMVHAANNLVSLGRGIGLRIILISQRPAKLHKDSLTQVETLVALRLIAPQDRHAIDDWIGEWADPKQGAELVASLPGLRTGEAWIWSPEAGILERRQTPLARTLDTGRPSSEPIELGTIDIAAVQERLGEVARDVLVNDPKTLRATIAQRDASIRDLEHRLAERSAPEPVIERVEVPVLDGQVDALRALLDGMTVLGGQLVDVAAGITSAIQRVSAPTTDPMKGRVVDGPRGVPARTSVPSPAGGDVHTVAAARPLAAARPAREGDVAGEVHLKAGAIRILETLARHHPMILTRAQVGTLTGFRITGGTFQTYWSTLRRAGYVDEAGGEIRVTAAGLDRAGVTASRASTTAELLGLWRSVLKAGARQMLDVLVDAHRTGTQLTRDDLAAATGMTASGGTFQTYLSILRRNGLVEVDSGLVRASDALFLGGAS